MLRFRSTKAVTLFQFPPPRGGELIRPVLALPGS